MEVTAINAPFQDREEAFGRIGIDIVPNVLFRAVVHGFGRFLPGSDVRIDVELIGDEPAVAVDMPGYNRSQIGGGYARNIEAANFAATLDQGYDRAFRRDRAEGPIGRLAAHVGFVGLDGFASTAHRLRERPGRLFYRLADAVPKEPGSFHAATERPLKLAGRDPLLGRAHEVERLKPNVQRDVAGLEDASHSDGKLFPAGIALVQAGARCFPVQFADPIGFPAMVADRTIGPELRFDVSESGFFDVEMVCGQFGLRGGLLLDREPTGEQRFVKCNIAVRLERRALMPPRSISSFRGRVDPSAATVGRRDHALDVERNENRPLTDRLASLVWCPANNLV